MPHSHSRNNTIPKYHTNTGLWKNKEFTWSQHQTMTKLLTFQYTKKHMHISWQPLTISCLLCTLSSLVCWIWPCSAGAVREKCCKYSFTWIPCTIWAFWWNAPGRPQWWEKPQRGAAERESPKWPVESRQSPWASAIKEGIENRCLG